MRTLQQTWQASQAGPSPVEARLVVIGDVHDQWGPEDEAALAYLAPDAAVFVGDFGNESVPLVQRIAACCPGLPKAVILGNHDAWYSMHASRQQQQQQQQERKAAERRAAGAAAALRSPPLGFGHTQRGKAQQPAQQTQVQQQQQQRQQQQQQGTASQVSGTAASGAQPCFGSAPPAAPDGVQQQLDALGSTHIGYGSMRVPGKDVNLVGARPFSKGGPRFTTSFMSRLYGVTSMKESAARIAEAAAVASASGGALVMLGHNGPCGLGSERHDICGADFMEGAGDHGDPDLAEALALLAAAGVHVGAVCHGHMHHRLKGGGLRRMVRVDAATGTVFLNAATVPRVRAAIRFEGSGGGGGEATQHHFMAVDLIGSEVHTASNIWVEVRGQQLPVEVQPQQSSVSMPVQLRVVGVVQEQPLLRTVLGANGVVKMVWDAHYNRWDAVTLGAAAAARYAGWGPDECGGDPQRSSLAQSQGQTLTSSGESALSLADRYGSEQMK